MYSIKSFCESKNSVRRVNEQHTKWKLSAKCIPDNELIHRVCKELQLNNNRKMFKWWIHLNKHFFKDIQMANKQRKRYSIPKILGKKLQ